MRSSKFILATVKEDPNDAELVSHKLMLRAGLIRRVASGIYSWLPLGLKVLRNVERIVREEMDKIGAQEILMPSVQPAELWQETARWNKYGKELLRFTDRHDREFCYGPTHEEVITDLSRSEINSYKQLPLTVYQIQTKFRDEIRPRFGVMRSREFLMKDAYSFHLDSESLNQTYQTMHKAYSTIFDRLGLNYRAVIADTGSIGGDTSHEFHVLARSGEDTIVHSDESDYAANIEKAEAVSLPCNTSDDEKPLKTIATPGQTTIQDLAEFLQSEAKHSIKTLLVRGAESDIVALLIRGDHELNELKAGKHPLVAEPLEFVPETEFIGVTKCPAGSLGPVKLPISTVIADHSVTTMRNFSCGANIDGKHYINVNFERDLETPESFDLRNVVEGDPSPDGKGKLVFVRGIEVGHIFQLGNQYSKKMNATVLDDTGRAQAMEMGCYGIGVSRIVAAAIEQNHDERGIRWPACMAPFDIALVPINYHRSQRVRDASEALYQKFTDSGYRVLFDDRKERPGVLFADMDLIGIPHRIVVGEKNLDNNQLEYQSRTHPDSELIELGNVGTFISKRIEV